jgi:lipopolysaccharide transport protein LptA
MAPQIPDSPELFSDSVPAPQPLKPRYPKPEKFNPGKEFNQPSGPDPKDDTMVITANRSEMDNNKKTLNFSGNVVVEMKDMEMTCDNLLVKLDSKQQMEEIIATGGTVQIKRIGEEGKLQVAKARRASHVAATQITTLSGGPPYLQDGDRYVNTDSEDARIVLSGDGTYRVDSPKGPGRSVIVVPISGAKKLTGDLGFENKLRQR